MFNKKAGKHLNVDFSFITKDTVMNGSFQAVENNLKHIMSSLGHKENIIFQQIVKDLNTHYHIIGNSFNIAIFSISQEDFQTLNQEQKDKLGEDFNQKQDQIIFH